MADPTVSPELQPYMNTEPGSENVFRMPSSRSPAFSLTKTVGPMSGRIPRFASKPRKRKYNVFSLPDVPAGMGISKQAE